MVLLGVGLSGCSSLQGLSGERLVVEMHDAPVPPQWSGDVPPEAAGGTAAPQGFVQSGSGDLLGRMPSTRLTTPAGDERITLNFEGADLREVIKVILGDMLAVNYIIDENIRGKATLHTQRPVSRDALLPILESVLQLNGAALVPMSGGYQITPMANAARDGAQVSVGRQLAGLAGYRVQVVPLQYVAAKSLQKVLEPVDWVAVVRHNRTLQMGNYRRAAEEGNFFLRGFNHLSAHVPTTHVRPLI